ILNINLELESWLSLGSLGLSIMFVLLLTSFYNFLIGTEGKGPERFVDINGVIIKTISISGAPSLILAGIAFGLSKNYGNKLSGLLLSLSGIIIIIGMIICINFTSNITSEFNRPILVIVPYIFIFGGIGIFIIGLLLYLKSKKGIDRQRRFN
ncbi:MAG TPA: hypothetical protein VJ583_06185, partial [Nitrososphaeraceae archaeon]|nr:hypothetical protein [Nitrososphaeraceae archaeon]